MANDSQNGNTPAIRHPQYYMGDGDITLIVENTIFCVHRFFFERESTGFFEKLAMVSQDEPTNGDLFRLEGITSAEFATFLWVWYSPKYRLDRKSKDDWLVILELSMRWQFPEMRELAIEQLQNLEIDPVEKIAIYDKYEIDKSLLLREYKRLCTREGRMSTEEGEAIKLPTVLGIYQARECAIVSASQKGHSNPTPADADEEELEKILIKIFNLNIHSSAGSLHGANNQILSEDTNRPQGHQPASINASGTTSSRSQTGPDGIQQNDTIEAKETDK